VDIAVDGRGRAYVTGDTEGDYPTTPGAFDTFFNGASDALGTKLPTG
jgi:Beta-propeller repeat